MNYYLGVDFGTSGARAIAINRQKETIAEANYSFSKSDRDLILLWQQALNALLLKISATIRKQIKAIAINGTSATILLTDKSGNPLGKPLLYNDDCGAVFLSEIENLTPSNSVVISATSSLAKLLWYRQQPYFNRAKYLLHQADWLSFLLHGKLGISDYHNALKLGYDVDRLKYPDWLRNFPFSDLFPQILAPGTPVKEVTQKISDRFSLPQDCMVCTGTTDSIAAFLASGATQPGEAVTSLGSTMVLKLLSEHKVTAREYGIYSHRWGNLWLTGGASNTGGAVLKHYFSDRQLQELSSHIAPSATSSLDYYPLLKVGERFPINDPSLAPQLSPRPDDPVDFLHGLLASMARIEAMGYQKLQELGATKLTRVYTAGGGARNTTWEKLRGKCLQVPVMAAKNTEAAYGSALLALRAISSRAKFEMP